MEKLYILRLARDAAVARVKQAQAEVEEIEQLMRDAALDVVQPPRAPTAERVKKPHRRGGKKLLGRDAVLQAMAGLDQPFGMGQVCACFPMVPVANVKAHVLRLRQRGVLVDAGRGSYLFPTGRQERSA